MTQAAAVIPGQESPPRDEELDLWWGSYSGLAMAPSFALCVALTMALYIGARWWVPQRGWMQLTFSILASLVWLVQLARLAHRCFTYNYRLTTRFVYVDRGIWPLVAQRMRLESIQRVGIQKNATTGWLGIGDVLVWLVESPGQPVVLRSLRGPEAAAELIRLAADKVRRNR